MARSSPGTVVVEASGSGAYVVATLRRPLDSRATLEARLKAISERHLDGKVPRPAHWSGFRIMPLSIEFWSRLRDEIRYESVDELVSAIEADVARTRQLIPDAAMP